MTSPHASDCAIYAAETPDEGPPYVGPCNCGATDILERLETITFDERMPKAVELLLAECAITIKALRDKSEAVK
jgi:hypothetical protein